MDDGELYLEFSDYNVDFEPKNVVAKLGNLFNGNKLLGELRNFSVTYVTVQLRRKMSP
jgi:hypothetical protein